MIILLNNKKIIRFVNNPSIVGYAAVGGVYEKEGPLGGEFDYIFEDPTAGEECWEQAESMLQKTALELALKKSGNNKENIDAVFAGDLLNQCVGSTFGIMEYGIPFAGVYGACSTMALSLIMASVFVDGGFATNAAAVTSSHFCSAERQFRFPLEYAGQRPPTAQRTTCASGAVIVSNKPSKIYVRSALLGKTVDYGIADANNMGAAMAPAAADTILKYLRETNTRPLDYDKIFTGDLGQVGSELLYDICSEDNVDLRKNHLDCGLLIYDRIKQNVDAGGSGCGCSASVLCTHILNKLSVGEYKRVLFCATGALLSPTTTNQGENIPSIAHLVELLNN
ncbi:MAG: stage V sporulation protein AD [Clostridia bacterium]|nr:stage V sporulation protein AD [Clostridia bacterium]